MRKKTTNTRMNEGLFWNVKQAINRGKTQHEVAEFFGVCKTSIGFINKAHDYKEFLEIQKKARKGTENKGGIEPVSDNETKTIIVSYDQFKALAQDVDKIRTTLDLILVGITELVECWKGEK